MFIPIRLWPQRAYESSPLFWSLRPRIPTLRPSQTHGGRNLSRGRLPSADLLFFPYCFVQAHHKADGRVSDWSRTGRGEFANTLSLVKFADFDAVRRRGEIWGRECVGNVKIECDRHVRSFFLLLLFHGLLFFRLRFSVWLDVFE